MRRSEKQITQQYIAPHHVRQITHFGGCMHSLSRLATLLDAPPRWKIRIGFVVEAGLRPLSGTVEHEAAKAIPTA